MMNPRRYALIGGILMLAIGALSLIPSLVGPSEGLPVLNNQASYGLFLGLFAMNIFNKVILIVFGLAGILFSRANSLSLPASIAWSRWVFAVMGVAAILGLFSQTNTLYGYMPLFGYEIGAHAFFAILGAYFGFALTAKVPKQPDTRQTDFRNPVHGTR